MVAIPKRDDPVILTIRYILEKDKAREPSRDYLGASELGQECSRRIWYNFNNYPSEPFTWKGCMAVNDGHRSEQVLIDLLRRVSGIELITEAENGGQIGFRDFDGRFKGHYDGLIRGLPQAPSTWHIWEAKSANEKRFKEFLTAKHKHGDKGALQAWDMTYYTQAQVYMHYQGFTRHYTTVALAGVRDIASCRTEHNKDFALAMVAKAKRIIDAKEPPMRISDSPSFYKCNWCPFKAVCHENT